MNDAKATIKDILQSDQVIRDLLPNGKSFYIMGALRGDSKLPALTFQDGPTISVGDRLFRTEIYVRVYDEPANGTINIHKIGSRMVELLHLKTMDLGMGRFIECRLNNTLGELDDQALGKRFVEYQFRVATI